MPPTLLSPNIPLRTETLADSRVVLEPRLSANQMAQYMVSDHYKQESIIRDAKFTNKILIARYSHGREALPLCYDSNGIAPDRLLAAAQRLKNPADKQPFEAFCMNLSAAALEELASFAQEIDCAGERVRRPQRGFGNLMVEGVRISVQPEIVFTAMHRNQEKYGAVLAHFAKSDSLKLDRQHGKYTAGNYLAFLVFQMLALNYASTGVRHTRCLAVDIYRRQVYQASSSTVTMLRNVEAACRSIARAWDDVGIE